MKIYTKKGDKGETSLIGGTRLPKFALRIDAYGTVDELNSHLGLIRDQPIDQIHINRLLEIQDRLFTIGSLLASDPAGTKMKLPELADSDVIFLEDAIDQMDSELPPMRNFVLPGGHTVVSFCHIARCVCRRAERLIIELDHADGLPETVLAYMNRLSDYLFLLSRKLTQELQVEEKPWNPRM